MTQLQDVKRCVYRYIDKSTGKIIYVGQTRTSLLQRINAHSQDPRFQKYDYDIEFCRINNPQSNVKTIESGLIDVWRPAINVSENSKKDQIFPHYLTLNPNVTMKWEKLESLEIESPLETSDNHFIGNLNDKRDSHMSLIEEKNLALTHTLHLRNHVSFGDWYRVWKNLENFSGYLLPSGKLPAILKENDKTKEVSCTVRFWERKRWNEEPLYFHRVDRKNTPTHYWPTYEGGPNLLFQIRLNQNWIYESMKESGENKNFRTFGDEKKYLPKMRHYNLSRTTNESSITFESVFGEENPYYHPWKISKSKEAAN